MTAAEARRAIRLLKKGEVYQAHVELWAVIFVRVFNQAWRDMRRVGALPESTMQGIITLLYKKGDPRKLTEYRGLTMLQRDYVQ